MQRKEMVRYGRVANTRVPKNTLVTFRNDDTVYFGISRCHTNEGDVFNKTDGVKLARLRADIAQQYSGIHTVQGKWTVDGSFYIHKSGLFGQVSVDEVPKLLSYFRDVDSICEEKAKSK